MTPQNRQPDGLSQLTELMRAESVPSRASAPKRTIDPQLRRRRRIRGRIIASAVIVAILGSAGGYVGWALTAPIGTADATTTVRDVVSPAAATVAISPEGASAMSVAGADEYLADGEHQQVDHRAGGAERQAARGCR